MKKLAIILLSVAFSGGVALACPHGEDKASEEHAAPKTAEKAKPKEADKAKTDAKAKEADKAKTAKPAEKPAEKKPAEKVSAK